MKKNIWSIFWLLMAGWTLVPVDASKACTLGYEAHCTFTPISTLVCLIAAWLHWWMPRRKKARAQ